MANPSFSDVLASAIENRMRKVSDNVTLHIPLYDRLSKRGNVIPFSGGSSILEELMYGTSSQAQWYSGYETINVQPQQVVSAAQYDIRFLIASVSISGEEELRVTGKEEMIPLLATKVDKAEADMMNALAIGMLSDGTGFSGKQIQGTRAFISTAPTSGTVGGINRANWTFWRNRVRDLGGTPPTADATTATSIHRNMSLLCMDLVRNQDYPDLWVGDANAYALYEQSLLPYQRVTAKDEYGSGFMALKFYGQGRVADVIFAGNGVNMPTNTFYALNTKYLRLRPHTKRNMTPLGRRQPVNQDATIQMTGWAGNMTCNKLDAQGILRWN